MSSVLVIDDRPADRTLLSSVLGYAGHEVREAASGEQALALIRAERPDLVISDLLMPGMNGYEFVRRLRTEPEIADIPVVFTTATYVMGEVRRLADACGVRHFLEKPWDPETVIETVSAALGGNGGRPAPAPDELEFDREQLRVLNDKLVEKMRELEEVSAERQALIVQLLHAQDEERRRLAAAIHDDPVQTVAAVSIRLETLESGLDEERKEEIGKLRRTVGEAIQSLRDLIFDLEPTTLRTDGLAGALRSYLDQHFSGDHEPKLDFRPAGEPDEATRSLLFRMSREALANVRRHAHARRVTVTVDQRAGLWSVTVVDDGRGFEPEEAMRVRPGHLGLPSMRERLKVAGGALDVKSAPGEGSRITIAVPTLEQHGS